MKAIVILSILVLLNFSNALSNSDITTKEFSTLSLYRQTKLWFESDTVPIAPFSGGVYILYALSSNKALKVLKTDNSFNEVATFDLGATGVPIDITSTSAGFVALLSDGTNKLYVQSYTSSGSLSWTKTICDNGAGSPPSTRLTSQVVFFKSGTTTPEYGMDLIYDPHNGRLVHANGRIGIIYAHYNYFPNGGGGHTGDTIITIDAADGGSVKLASSWGTSHSLCQRLIYDSSNSKFVTVALGDAYNEAVTASIFDGTSSTDRLTFTSTKKLVTGGDANGNGAIPGTGSGKSSGRLGGLIKIADGKYGFVYSRQSGLTGMAGISNSVSELAYIVFGSNLQVLTYVPLATLNDVNSVKSALYGSNILITYTRTTRVDSFYPFGIASDVTSADTMYCMVIDTNGNTVTPAFSVSPNSMGATDDIRVLSDGSVVWTYVTDSKTLKIVKVPSTSTAPSSSTSTSVSTPTPTPTPTPRTTPTPTPTPTPRATTPTSTTGTSTGSCATTNGKTCIFPFTYNGATYTKCVNGGTSFGYWCATAVSNGALTDFGICAVSGCSPSSTTAPTPTPTPTPTAPAGTTTCKTQDGGTCIFPFSYSGTTYNKCVDGGTDFGFWCATQTDSSGSLTNYGICTISNCGP